MRRTMSVSLLVAGFLLAFHLYGGWLASGADVKVPGDHTATSVIQAIPLRSGLAETCNTQHGSRRPAAPRGRSGDRDLLRHPTLGWYRTC